MNSVTAQILKWAIPILLICGFGTFVYIKAPTWIQHQVQQAVQAGLDVEYNAISNKLEVNGHKLDSLGTIIAGTHYLDDPNFLQTLFSNQAKHDKKFRDSILSLIPAVVSNEFKKYGASLTEVGQTLVITDTVLVRVKVGNSIKFVKGSLTYIPDSNLYELYLKADTIEITDVRSNVKENGQLLTSITAKSRLTGTQLTAFSDRYFIDWGTTRWDFSPFLVAGVGGRTSYDNLKPLLSLSGGLDWVQYNGDMVKWTALKLRANHDGLSLETEFKYRLFLR
jgi:hypothetical protein